ncbi:DeoR/GlpR family DNA-binding transcription regulator [Demequina sp. NBRC 110054]|uniref:DeoR/GlpR family DNA-binding transcription regulator n=1 Tax=Demequina sp. NBRC 110054 TaxID=1570343 RepID=UPI000A01D8F4|nr:DeoR/GlpR family DNA-binding transcription regulator [Demequina sp. NBRC 110054]
MYAAERQHEILTRARANGRVEVGPLADSLGVTVETVRRDLTALERMGAVRRVHGGALPVERLALEPNLAARESRNSEQKRRIATRALEEVPTGGTMLLDAGTTMLAIAEALPADLEATVVTNSVAIASRLADHPGIELLMLGGRIRQLTGAAVGDWTESELEPLCVDVAFVGTNGLTVERGLTTPDQTEAAAKRAMVLAGRRVIALADATKVGPVHLHRFAALDELAMLITDDSLDEETAAEIVDAGVEVARV